MNAEGLLNFLNNVDNWYLSRDSRLYALATNSISSEEFELYQVQPNGTESPQEAFLAMNNVLGSMQQPGIIVFYLMQGVTGSINYYYGIGIDTTYNLDLRTKNTILYEASTVFYATYTANFPANSLRRLSIVEKSIIIQSMCNYAYTGILEGVPGQFDTSSGINGANKVMTAMQSDDFMVIKLARPLGLRQNNCLSCNVEQVTTTLEPLANRTENSVCSDSKNNSFNVNAGNFYSYNIVRGNSETRREYRFTDPDTGEVIENVPQQETVTNEENEPNTNLSETPVLPRTISRRNGQQMRLGGLRRQNTRRMVRGTIARNQNSIANDLGEAVLESETGQVSNLAEAINSDLTEDEAFEAQELSCMQVTPTSSRPLVIPTGTAVASSFLGGNLPLVDGDFLISNIERQVSLSNSSTCLQTNSDTVASTVSNSATRTRTCVRNISNRNANKWVSYNESLLSIRLDYAKAEGLFLLSTGIFANTNTVLIKLASTLRYMYNASTMNKIPVILTPISSMDVRIASLCNFQIPEYVMDRNFTCFPIDEIVARSTFSEYVTKSVAYGGNWLSSKELGSIFAVPEATAVNLEAEKMPKNEGQ